MSAASDTAFSATIARIEALVCEEDAAMRFGAKVHVALTRGPSFVTLVIAGPFVLADLRALHQIAPEAWIDAWEIEEEDFRGKSHFTRVAWKWRPEDGAR